MPRAYIPLKCEHCNAFIQIKAPVLETPMCLNCNFLMKELTDRELGPIIKKRMVEPPKKKIRKPLNIPEAPVTPITKSILEELFEDADEPATLFPYLRGEIE